MKGGVFCRGVSQFQLLCTDYLLTIVPGDGGSQIEAKLNKTEHVHWFCKTKSDWYTLWLAADLLLPDVIDCWTDNMRLKYDPETHTTRNNDGVETRIPGFGNTSTVEVLGKGVLTNRYGQYFYSIVNGLVELGYERGVNIHGAPYDFRKAASKNGSPDDPHIVCLHFL